MESSSKQKRAALHDMRGESDTPGGLLQLADTLLANRGEHIYLNYALPSDALVS